MTFLELLVIAVGLSMDAFAVSIAKGLAVREVRLRHLVVTGVWFGGFQALMPVVGYMLGATFSTFVANVDHWIAFVLLGLIGSNMIRGSFCGDDEAHDADFSARKMFPLAVATSIDALAVGVSFAFLGVSIWSAAIVIGITTYLFSAAGVRIGHRFGSRYQSKAEFLGGVVLVLMGIKILVEHTVA